MQNAWISVQTQDLELYAILYCNTFAYVGQCYSDLSRYLQTVDPWMSPAGKKDEDRKVLLLLQASLDFNSELVGSGYPK